MTFQIAIARYRELPTIDQQEYETVEAARQAADSLWRSELRRALDPRGQLPAGFQHHPRGDVYVIPQTQGYISSAQVRDQAVYSLAGRDWHEAFTAAEMTTWEAARER